MHAARRRRRRDGFSRTRDGRAPRSQGPGRRGTGGRPLTSLPKRWRRFGDRRRFVSDDTLGRGDAAARGDRHPGFGRARSRPGRGRRGLHHLWPIGAGPRRGLPVLLLIGLVGPQDGWALGRRGRRLPGRGALGTDRLAIRLLGLRLCVFDHRQRGLRPCVFDHRQRGLRPCVFDHRQRGLRPCVFDHRQRGLRPCVFDHRQRGLRPCVFDHRQRGLRLCVFDHRRRGRRRLCVFDHRRRGRRGRRGRRLQQTVARCPSPDAVGLGFDNA